MEPLVSVIIPVYNVLPYLREALDSVINQTYKNLEILVVDDGSTDGSGEVCDEYLSDPRVIVIHQENKGLSGARNTGLDRMTGEYVAFLDSDDAFMPEMIEKMLCALIQNKVDIIMCNYNECHTKKRLSSFAQSLHQPIACLVQEVILSPSDALNSLVSATCGWTIVWNKLYAASLWTKIRFPEGTLYEDVFVTYQIFANCQGLLLFPESLVLYRKRNGSITKTKSIKHIHDFLLGTKIVESFIALHASDIFLPKNAAFHRVFNAHILSNKYGNLLYMNCPHDVLSFYRQEIRLQWRLLENVPMRIQSRIIRLLFLYAPLLILPLGTCWRFGKRLFSWMHI